MKALDTIRQHDPQLADQIVGRHGFLLDSMLPRLIQIDRLMPVVIRCNACRMTVAVQDVQHVCDIITEHAELKAKAENVELAGDWVRDISLA